MPDNMNKITLLDSTLRDGTQGEGISLSEDDKIKIMHALDELGIDFIEAGNPASNPKDMELFNKLKYEIFKNSMVCAFGSTRKKDMKISDDWAIRTLEEAGTPAVSIVGKASLKQAETILRTTAEENLLMVKETVEYFKNKGKYVIFDAEHFFDAFKESKDYTVKVIEAAKAADIICLCDTNGGSYTEEIYDAFLYVKQKFPEVSFGVHCHNDCGLAIANSMRAVDAGALHVQGTYLGFGERCGNTNLSTLIANLSLKRGIDCIPDLTLLTHTARRIADVANYTLPNSRPYIGRSAFAHKGGMHIDAVNKESSSFEHISPELVGNHRRFLISEMSGKSTLMNMINEIDSSIERDSREVGEIIEELKLKEMEGYQFEGAEGSFELLILRKLGRMKKFFDLDYYKTISEQPLPQGIYPASAVMKVRVGNETEITAAEGNGPVNALDLALRKALTRFYPKLKEMYLTDFKVRVLESDGTTAVAVRVLIESSDGNRKWSTVGVSNDVIEASFIAMRDAVEYKLMADLKEI